MIHREESSVIMMSLSLCDTLAMDLYAVGTLTDQYSNAH